MDMVFIILGTVFLILLMVLFNRTLSILDFSTSIIKEDIFRIKLDPSCQLFHTKLPPMWKMLVYFWIPLKCEVWFGFTTLREYYKSKREKINK